MMYCRTFILLILTGLPALFNPAGAQEIDFSSYGTYTISAGELSPGEDLDFGIVVRESGQHSIDINNSKILTITGVEYLDVFVEITAENSLYLDGNPGHAGDSQKSIPFTLEAAYANSKGTPTIGQAKFLNVTNNSVSERFPILERQSQPPGPPPPPPTDAFDQAQVEETAYLYLYGLIDVGDVDAGSYSSEITVTINYD